MALRCPSSRAPRWRVPSLSDAARRGGRLLAVVALMVALGACVSIESRFVFDEDGTGDLHLVYRLDPAMAELGNAAAPGALPLPISERDFRAATAVVDGLELTEYRRDDGEDAVVVSATLHFERVRKLAELPSFADLQPRLEGGDPATFQLVLGIATDDPALDAGARELLNMLFGDHVVSFVVEAPRPIRDRSEGVLSEGGRQVTVTIPLARYAAQRERQVLTVRW